MQIDISGAFTAPTFLFYADKAPSQFVIYAILSLADNSCQLCIQTPATLQHSSCIECRGAKGIVALFSNAMTHTVTVILTRTKWVQAPSTFATILVSSSRAAEHGEKSSEEYHMGIVSGTNHPRQTSESPSPARQPRFKTNTTTATNSYVAAPLSPSTSVLQPSTTQPNHPHFQNPSAQPHLALVGSSRMSTFEPPDIPLSVGAFMLILLSISLVWLIVVWLIHFPPHTWFLHTRSKLHDFWTWLASTIPEGLDIKRRWNRKKDPGPADKERRYAPVPSSASSGDDAHMPTVATSSATCTPARDAGSPHAIRLRKMPSPLPASPSRPPWEPAVQSSGRARTPPPLAHTPPHRSTTSGMRRIGQERGRAREAAASPENPFLPAAPAHAPRSSDEYRAAYDAFFSRSLPTTRLPSPVRASRRSADDVDALEKQVDPPRRRPRSFVHAMDSVRENGSKLGGLLGMVEKGVNSAVDAVARWSEDADGDEGLLLPMKRGDVE